MRRFVGVLANRNVGYLLVIALLGIPMLLGISYMARSFGDWTLSSTTDDVASSSPSSWFLVPLDLAMLIASFHLMNTRGARQRTLDDHLARRRRGLGTEPRGPIAAG